MHNAQRTGQSQVAGGGMERGGCSCGVVGGQEAAELLRKVIRLEKKPVLRAVGASGPEERPPPAFSDQSHRKYVFLINPSTNEKP